MLNQHATKLQWKHGSTYRRRMILKALSWASLFEDNPLFASSCLDISSSTFQDEHLLNIVRSS